MQSSATQDVAAPGGATAPASAGEAAALAMLREAARRVLGHTEFVEIIQLSRRGGLALVRHDGALQVFKLINCQADWKKRWARRIGWNPARGAARASAALAAAGLPVCAVEGHGSVSLPGAPRAVWTRSLYVPNGRTLRQLKLELQPGRRATSHPVVARLFDEALRLLRRIHDAGFEHRDYHAGNLLASPADEQSLRGGQARLRLVDLETVVARRASVPRRARDLRRFLENFVEPEDFAARIDHALAVYAGSDAGLARAITATRRMQGLLRKRGISRGDTVGDF